MISITNLSKRYGRLQVLDRLSLQVEAGGVTAIVGPNGSGKTTLIKTILGLTRPDTGFVKVAGADVAAGAAYRADIGYMPQYAPFPENLTPQEILSMLRDLRSVSGARDEELIAAFGLAGEMDKPVRTLSGGTRQRLSAVAAFLFRPSLLILDEPTAGLDPVASSVLKDKIEARREDGATVVLTSHIMSEIQELAETLVFLLDGAIRYNGPVHDLLAATGHDRLERAVAQLMMRRTFPYPVAA